MILLAKMSSLISMYQFFIKMQNSGRITISFSQALNMLMLNSFVPAISERHLPTSGSEMENALLIDKRHKRVKGRAMFRNIS